jgi:exoribonuclease R
MNFKLINLAISLGLINALTFTRQTSTTTSKYIEDKVCDLLPERCSNGTLKPTPTTTARVVEDKICDLLPERCSNGTLKPTPTSTYAIHPPSKCH